MKFAISVFRHAAVLGILVTTMNRPALAQEQDDQDAALEEIVVTGSYLYTGVDSPSPVQVILGDDLVEFMPTDLNEFFFDYVTQNFGNESIAQSENAGMARTRGFRSTSVNLRNLGPENTLSLINGRRVVPYAIPTGMGWNVTDINSVIPRIAIGRADLLLDGGSATFGSDPVAGVINLVSRQGFNGFEMNFDSRIYEEATDKKNITLSGLWGHSDDTTSVLAALEFHEEERVLIRDLDGDVNLDPDITDETGTGLTTESRLLYSGPTVGMGMGAFTPEFPDSDCGNPALGAPSIARYPAFFDGNDILRPTTIDLATDCAESSGFNPNGDLAGNNTENILGFLSVEHAFSNRVSASAEVSFGRTEYADEEIWGDNAGNAWAEAPVTRGTEFAIPIDHPGYLRAQSIIPTFGQVPGAGMGMGPPPPPVSPDFGVINLMSAR